MLIQGCILDGIIAVLEHWSPALLLIGLLVLYITMVFFIIIICIFFLLFLTT